MARRESWSAAYARTLAEVRAEMPDAEDDEVYAEYRLRCLAWKAARGIR